MSVEQRTVLSTISAKERVEEQIRLGKERGLFSYKDFPYLQPKIVDVVVEDRARQGVGDLSKLKKSIEEIGLLHPIGITPELKLVYGARRLEACRELGWETIPAMVGEYPTLLEQKKAELHENSTRLDFTWQEEARLVEEIDHLGREVHGSSKAGGDRQSEKHCSENEQWSVRKTAEDVGISLGRVSEALKLAEGLKAHPEIEDIKKKTEALKQLKRIETHEELLSQPAASLPPSIVITHSRIEDAGSIVTADSVDLLLTDPPYGEQYLPLWNELGKFAKTVLKPGGFLVAYSGQYYLPDVMAHLSQHLQYYWTLALTHNGAVSAIHPRKINNKWKPILVFGKPPLQLTEYIDDVINGTGREKELHDWAQALGESETLLQLFSKKGAVVVDPFLGSGTTALACKKQERSFIGFDADKTTVEIAKARVSQSD